LVVGGDKMTFSVKTKPTTPPSKDPPGAQDEGRK